MSLVRVRVRVRVRVGVRERAAPPRRGGAGWRQRACVKVRVRAEGYWWRGKAAASLL